METIFRGVAVYWILLLMFRFAGKRAVTEATTFDFVVLLIIAEVTQQALTAQDYSVTNTLLLVATLLGLDVLFSIVKQRFPAVERFVDGIPVVIVDRGRPRREVMDKERIDELDILEAARASHGLERMDQVKYAVLERSGGISIIPRQG